jgi:hypothetical protein
MSDLQGGQPHVGPVTVEQLQAQLDQIQTVLSTAAAVAAELQDWSRGLARRYPLPTDEVLVTELMRRDNPDPTALQRQACDAEDLAVRAAAAITQLRGTAADTGLPLGRSLRQTSPLAGSAESEAGTDGEQPDLDEYGRALSGAWHLLLEGGSWVLANQNQATGFYRIHLGSIRTATDLVRVMRALAMRAETEPGYDVVHGIRALDAIFGQWIAGPWLDPIQPESLDKRCRERHARDSEAAQLRRMVDVPGPDRRRWWWPWPRR